MERKHSGIISSIENKEVNLSGTSNKLVRSTSSSSSGLDLNEKPIYEGPLNRYLNNAISFSEGGYRNNDVTNALMYMIAVDNLPLRNTPEKPGFRMFVQKLQPLIKPPCEPTITKRMTAKYEELKIRVKAELREADSVCLTTDIWTHKNTMRSYLGLTVHYLKGYEMKSYELGAYYLQDRKTIAILRMKLRDICNEWDIHDDKISTAVSDGGANIKGAIKEEFGESKHISCFGHAINNIGQKLIEVDTSKLASELSDDNIHHLLDDESDTEEFFCEDSQNSSVRNLIMKVKKIVKFFRCSEIASRELEILQEQSGFHRDKSSRSKPPEILTAEELDALIEIRDILKPLWHVTHEVSADKEVTLSKCIPLITGLKRGTDRLCPVTSIGIQMKKNLVAEIKQKFSNIESVKVYSIATLLDPRFKKIVFQNIQNPARAVTTVGEILKKEIKSSKTLAITCENNLTDHQLSSGGNDLWDFLDDAVQHNIQVADSDEAGGLPIELGQFLNRSTVDRKTNPNPIATWQSYESDYPHLSPIARKYSRKDTERLEKGK
ncbi:uncharacterized protein LOC124180631 [Neodiprion fabricii]|uniref:uncharacterized protein LOC124180631 n=1 Tax=Neodiprion fabricii TaxID=2872261 RepID=UPI001ED93DB9|nr:uncharacterized protein LOC124180631 [Neodiprion fabricii]